MQGSAVTLGHTAAGGSSPKAMHGQHTNRTGQVCQLRCGVRDVWPSAATVLGRFKKSTGRPQCGTPLPTEAQHKDSLKKLGMEKRRVNHCYSKGFPDAPHSGLSLIKWPLLLSWVVLVETGL